MNKSIILFFLYTIVIVVACDVKEPEPGYAKIYFTKITEGNINLTPEEVTIDKESKTMNFVFGVYRSGMQKAESFSVELFVDNENVPGGTYALTEEQYTLTVENERNTGRINFPDSKKQLNLQLTIPQEVFEENLGRTLSLRIALANPTRYELSEELSATNLLVNVSQFIGNYGDVTDKYIRNAKSPFDVTPDSPPKGTDNPCHQTPTDWVVNDAVKIHDFNGTGNFYGGVDARVWGDRDWLGASNWDNGKAIVNGKIYQTTTLPAGEYIFEYEIGENAGGAGYAAFVIAAGKTLPDFDELDNSIVYIDFTSNPSIQYTFDTECEVSIGFVYDIPAVNAKYAYFIKNLYIKKKTNVFAE